jgi:hypothetical protein
LSYIGNQPAEKYTTFSVQHFTTSATTTYTLDHPVANENEIALFINNVRQEPGSSYAYTADGTNLVLSAATAGTDTMYCVFIGKAVQTITPGANSITANMFNSNTSFEFPTQLYVAEATLTDGATISWNLETQQVAKVTLGGNRTLAAPTNQNAGGFYGLMIIQDGTGSRTLSFNTVYKFTNGIAPTLSTAAAAKDILVFRSDGTNLYEVGRSVNVS